MKTDICKCGHEQQEHKYQTSICGAWLRYPEVLNARQCGCKYFKKENTK